MPTVVIFVFVPNLEPMLVQNDCWWYGNFNGTHAYWMETKKKKMNKLLPPAGCWLDICGAVPRYTALALPLACYFYNINPNLTVTGTSPDIHHIKDCFFSVNSCWFMSACHSNTPKAASIFSICCCSVRSVTVNMYDSTEIVKCLSVICILVVSNDEMTRHAACNTLLNSSALNAPFHMH